MKRESVMFIPKRELAAAVVVAAALLCATSAVAALQETPPIRNFLRVNREFCTGGQPRLEHLAKLKEEGVRAVINLRQPGEHRAEEERAEAERLGLRYFNIPVAYGGPKDEQATEFLKLTDDEANRPAFIHCTGAIRVGAFWMIRRVLRDGWTVEDAEKEAEKVGLREAPHLNEFARAYIEKHRKK
ncbi:MAG: protein tyrosine phosphatase family protein [Acidobacteria bacterium]|nr:protein tyrosine phosphatase family protein [Acidobacteriota bacterium]